MVEQRARSIQGLPGRVEDYPDTLRQLLAVLADGDSPIDDYVRLVMTDYEIKESSAKSVLYNALRVLGFVECDGTSVGLTEAGRRYVRNPDRALIGEALREHVVGVSDIIEVLGERPQRISDLHAAMNERGFAWKSVWQIRYRLKWLRTAGLVRRRTEAESSGRYPEWALTDPGTPVT